MFSPSSLLFKVRNNGSLLMNFRTLSFYPLRQLSTNGLVARVTRDPSKALIWTLIGTNVLVHSEWQRADYQLSNRRDPSLLRWMSDNFTTGYRNVISDGRWHTLLTSAFSHRDPMHLAFNMLALWSFGGGMVQYLGVRRFLAVYLGGALAASLTGIAYRYLQHKYSANNNNRSSDMQQLQRSSLGASGGLMSMLGVFGMLFPEATVYLLFIPVPARFAVLGYAAYDYFMLNSQRSGTDHIGHLGGLAFGLSYVFLRIR